MWEMPAEPEYPPETHLGFEKKKKELDLESRFK